MRRARAVMVQGTGSSVGKSVIATALFAGKPAAKGGVSWRKTAGFFTSPSLFWASPFLATWRCA